jgi:hypothetical protein
MTPASTPSRQPLPIDENTVRAVVGRVDRVESDLAKLTSTVTGLNGAVKRLLTAEQEKARQPDWLAVDKPAVAEAMLMATADWADRYGTLLGLMPQPCWPWHAHLVAVLVAAAQHHAAIYAGPNPVAVTDYLTRHLPAIAKQLREGQGSCREAIHLDGRDKSEKYVVHRDQLPDLARWWATDRTGLAPGLTPARVAAA